MSETYFDQNNNNNNNDEEIDDNSNSNNNNNSSFLDSIIDNVKVCVRIKPNTTTSSTSTSSSSCIAGIPSKNTIILNCKPNESKVFTFDKVATSEYSQIQIFNSIAKPILNSFTNGFNGCIFAYGQSGSGKSYTIGTTSESSPPTTDHDNESKGIIPRTFEYLFQKLNEKKTKGEINSYECTLSYIEVYNEQIYNLLDINHHNRNNNNLTSLQIREDLKKGIYIEGLKEFNIKDSKMAMKIFEQGCNNRKVAETLLNSNSSRSHSVLTLNLQIFNGGLTTSSKIYSKLSIIDLAGSERQRKSETSGIRLKEASKINKSLLILGNVIRSLVELSNGKPRHVPYRDSKLTLLLRDSLGGNSKTFIIATVSQNENCLGETLSTLQFAQRAKLVKNIAIVNEESSGNITLLQLEIKRLKEELYKIANNSSIITTTPTPTPSTLLLSPSPPSSKKSIETTSSSSSSFEKRIYDLEVQLSRSLDREELLNTVVNNLNSKFKATKVLIEKKDHFLLNTKLILKLRESHIARLENKTNRVLHSTREKELLDEINILNNQISLHPEVTKLKIENIDLNQKLSNYSNNNNIDDELLSSSYKQQINELIIEVNTLLKEKHLLKSSSSVVVPSSTTTTTTTTTKKLEDELNFKLIEFENEKNQMSLDYQKLHSKFINLSSEFEIMKQSNSELNEKYIKLLQDNNKSNDLEKQELLNKLFEKDQEIQLLKQDLDSTKLSNQKISEIFIKTPIRTAITTSTNIISKTPKTITKLVTSPPPDDNEDSQDQDEDSQDDDPIKFNLNISSSINENQEYDDDNDGDEYEDEDDIALLKLKLEKQIEINKSLKLENQETFKQLDKIDDYQSQVSDLYSNLNEKDKEIELLNAKLEILKSKYGNRDCNIDVVIISSDDEDDENDENDDNEVVDQVNENEQDSSSSSNEEEEEEEEIEQPVVFCKPYNADDNGDSYHQSTNNNSNEIINLDSDDDENESLKINVKVEKERDFDYYLNYKVEDDSDIEDSNNNPYNVKTEK